MSERPSFWTPLGAFFSFVSLSFVSPLFVSCLPALEGVYRDEKLSQPAESRPAELKGPAGMERGAAVTPAEPALLLAVDENSYRVRSAEDELWHASIEVLMRNYNLDFVDRASGVVSTGWDSYYLNGGVFRNRLSLRVRRIGLSQSELMINNNTEALKKGGPEGGSNWLPSADEGREVRRIVKNISQILLRSRKPKAS